MHKLKQINDQRYRLKFNDDAIIDIGDDAELKFKPIFNFKRTDKYFFKATPQGDFDLNDPSHEMDLTEIRKIKITDDTGDIAVHCYEKEPGELADKGKFEFSIVLNKKPVQGVDPTFDIVFDIVFAKDMEFWKQIPYNERIISGEDTALGVVKRDARFGYDSEDNVICSMPEAAVNSYAVMAPGKYKSYDKLFHIPAPEAVDALDSKQWCDLDINPVVKTMTIKVPWTYLNSATYPVEIDPTFGYTTLGSGSTSLNGIIIGSKDSPSNELDVESLWVGLNSDWDSGENVKMALYWDDGTNGHLQTPQSVELSTGHGTTQFVEFAVASPGSVRARSTRDYLIAAWGDSATGIQRDYNGSNVSRWYNSLYGSSWPDNIILSNSVYDYSTYAEGPIATTNLHWGLENNVATGSSGYRNNRYLSGQSPNLDNMVVKAIWFRSTAAGTAAVALHTGGSSGSPPSGDTQRTEAHNQSISSGWNRIAVSDYAWPKNTWTWINVVHGTTTAAYYTDQSSESEDFDPSNGRYSVGTPSDEDETSQLPTTIGSGTFSSAWYNVYVEYDIITFGDKVHGVVNASIGKVLGVDKAKIAKVIQ